MTAILPAIIAIAPKPGVIDRLQNYPLIWFARQPLLWASIAIVLGPYLFWRGFQLLKNKRLIMNIPRSTVRSAALGAVEIAGRATGPYTLVSPLANVDCYYCRVQLRVLAPGASKGKLLVDESCAPLFVDDGTGHVLLDPRGAQLMIPASQADAVHSEYLHHVLARHGYRDEQLLSASEVCIQPGDSLFVLGTLQENPWAKQRARSAFERIGPGFVPEAEAAIQQTQALPAAAIPAFKSPRATTDDYDLYPATILSRGTTPFVISSRSEREVLAQMNWTSVLYIWAGPIMTVVGVWELLSRLAAWRLGLAR